MKLSVKHLFATLILLGGLMTMDLYAPPTAGVGGVSGSEPTCWPPPCIPIDGGVGFLLLAGAALGAKRLFVLK